MNIQQSIQEISESEGISREEVVQQFVAALLGAADATWGEGRSLKAYDDGDDIVIHQSLLLDDASMAEALGCEVGDELLVQVFYRDEHAELARAHAEAWPQLPTVAELAPELRMPAGPTWLSKLWPRRRDPSLWGLPVELPDFDTALQRVEALLRAETTTDWGSPPQEVASLVQLGTVPTELAEFYRRIGPVGRSDDASVRPLYLFGAVVLSIPEIFEVRELEAEFRSDQPGQWSPSLVPVCRGPHPADLLVVDVDGALGGEPGPVIRRTMEGDLRVLAPSFADWIRSMALGIERGSVIWDGEEMITGRS